MRPILLLALLALPTDAQAQVARCTDHATMVRVLAERWGESRQAIGLDASGAVVEIFASEATGTWTLVVTAPGGPSCIYAAGQAFERTEEAEGDPA